MRHACGWMLATVLVCSAGAWGAPAEADGVRAVVAEMLADAQERATLLASGDAGHDGKFFIAGRNSLGFIDGETHTAIDLASIDLGNSAVYAVSGTSSL